MFINDIVKFAPENMFMKDMFFRMEIMFVQKFGKIPKVMHDFVESYVQYVKRIIQIEKYLKSIAN